MTAFTKTIDGLCLHEGMTFSDSGSGKPCLVFVHGWACDGSYWSRQASELSDQFRVVVVDLPAHGSSRAAFHRHDIDAYGNALAKLIEVLSLTDVILIGHSMGGAIITSTARHLEGRIRGLVAVDMFRRIDDKPMNNWLAKFLVNAASLQFKRVTRYIVVKAFFTASSPPELVKLVSRDMANGDKHAAVGSMISLMTYNYARSLRLLYEASQPRLTIINSDYLSTDVEALIRAYHTADFIPVSATSHFPMLESPDAFNRLLRRVIGSLTVD